MKKLAIVLIFVTAIANAQQAKRKLVWEEEFNTKVLNEKVWNFEMGNGCPDNCGWGNNEKQLYTKTNHVLKDGNLVITVNKENDHYTSTRITTAGKKEFLYGRMEARAKIPVGQGIWPAFWMLGSNIGKVGWPKSGEIDILEYVGRDPDQVYTTLHTQDSHGNSKNSKKTEIKNIEEGFHLYAVDWTKDKIDAKNEDIWPFDQPFFFILNVAVGGNFGGHEVDNSIFPQQFVVDYIRVYQ